MSVPGSLAAALAQTVATLFDGEALPENREGIGNTPARRDGAAKVAGTAEFAADTAPPGAWGLRVLRAPDAPARFTLGDLSAFRAAHPALLVLTAADIPGRNGHGVHPDHRVQPVLATETAAFPGEAVLALVGPEDALARVADADLRIAWTPLPTPPPEVFVERRVHRGDMGAALAAAPVAITRTATTGAVAQAALEPEAGWAEPWGDGGVSITATTPAPTSCWATCLPVAASALSSTDTTSSCTRLPSTMKPSRFSSFTARFTPLSRSCPSAPRGPVRGWATPILRVSGTLLQPASTAAATKVGSRAKATGKRRRAM